QRLGVDGRVRPRVPAALAYELAVGSLADRAGLVLAERAHRAVPPGSIAARSLVRRRGARKRVRAHGQARNCSALPALAAARAAVRASSVTPFARAIRASTSALARRVRRRSGSSKSTA